MGCFGLQWIVIATMSYALDLFVRFFFNRAILYLLIQAIVLFTLICKERNSNLSARGQTHCHDQLS